MTCNRSERKPAILTSESELHHIEHLCNWEKWLREVSTPLLSTPACLIAGILSFWNSLSGLSGAGSSWSLVSLVVCLFCVLVGMLRMARPAISLAKAGFEACLRGLQACLKGLNRVDNWAARVFPTALL